MKPLHIRAATRAGVAFVALITVAVSLSSCGGRKSHPFASFASRCGQLPPPRFAVVQVPVSYVEDDTESIATLTSRSGGTPATHRTVGLTVANLSYEASIELHSVSEGSGGRACGTPDIRVELSLQPLTVYVAREFADSRCERDATLEHEMRHVEVHRAMFDQAAETLRQALPRTLGTGVLHAPDQRELEQKVNNGVRSFIRDFMQQRQQVLVERQEEVDSPDEYQRLAGRCG